MTWGSLGDPLWCHDGFCKIVKKWTEPILVGLTRNIDALTS